MASYGVDLRARRSKSLTEFSHQSFDYVITLCDKVREVCPTFPGSPETIHWSIPDPATAQGRAATNTAFAAVALDLRTRISHLLSWALPNAA
jgi:protein-tyrosine-phosphatase